MKKKIIIGIVLMSLLVVVVAGVGSFINKEIPSDRINVSEQTDLKTMGVGNISYNEYEDGDDIVRELISTTDFNLPEIKINKFYMNCTNITYDLFGDINGCNTYEQLEWNETQIQEMLDEKQIITLKDIVKVWNDRKNRGSKTLVRGGNITFGK